MKLRDAPATAGWVLYDADCGFCRRGIARFEQTLKRRGFGVAALQADWVRDRLRLEDDDLLADIRLLLPDGSTLAGADVYRYCMRRIWWAWPLWLFSVLPVKRKLFDWAYRRFARNRYCLLADARCSTSRSTRGSRH